MSEENIQEKFFNKLWVKVVSVLISICTLIGIGYKIGIFRGEVDCKIDKMKVVQEYQAKLQHQKEQYTNSTILQLRKEVSDVKRTIEFLEKKSDEE